MAVGAKWSVMLVLAAGAIFAAGCGSGAAQSGETKYVTEAVTVASPEQEAAEPTGEPATASGRGSDSLRVDLTPGLATFSYEYQDEGPIEGYFSIELLDGSGRPVALIANGVGTTEGSKSVRIPRQGTYTINVSADRGSWTLTGPPKTE